MNIRQCRGNCLSQIQLPLHRARFARAYFLAVGMLVPATDRRGLGESRGESPCAMTMPSD